MNQAQNSNQIEALLQQGLAERLAPTETVCVAFSGGCDSSVLLHALSRLLAPERLRAIHVNHGLHPDAAQWAAACESRCAEWGVRLTVATVEIEPNAPGGLEARARDARYEAFRRELKANEVLVLAHHQNDQAETFLLRLLRGAGPEGLASMSDYSTRSDLAIWRPLLNVSQATLHKYANQHELVWLDDPTNAELGLDRNFLRHEILPRLTQRWPAANKVIARSARLCANSAAIIAEQANADLGAILTHNNLALPALAKLPAARQAEVLRAALKCLELPLPSEQQLNSALSSLLEAREKMPELANPVAGRRHPALP